MMTDITANLRNVRQKIQQAAEAFNRKPGTVQLLAVSKGQSVFAIKTALMDGQRAFGESYLQEALSKMADLADQSVEWHFIGTVQSNKTRTIAEKFDWVHSVTQWRIAERLNRQRPASLPPLNVCIEVNISHEFTKTGITIEDVRDLAKALQQLPRLSLRGLMAIPEPVTKFQQQLLIYQKVYTLQQQLIEQGLALDTLSMGMSDDFVAAIAAGSTIVRIGRLIFGNRST